MKKISSIFFLLGISLFVLAQEETPAEEAPQPKKEASSFLPAEGDFAIGVDAMPYLEFLGNMFSGHDQRNTLNVGQSTIYGKYYLNPDAALRAELFINKNTYNDVNYVQNDALFNSDPTAQVEDLRLTKYNSIGFGAGYQKYRGYGKLRGTYGVLASYYLNKYTTEYTWGNQMSASNTNPTSTNWYGAGSNPAERNLTEATYGNTTLGLGLISGIEYFILPKICLGGEFGIYYNYTWNGQESYTYEVVQQGVVQEYDQAVDPKESSSSLNTRVYNAANTGGRIYLLFHF